MTKLEEIESLWAKDCRIDSSDLAEESLRISEIHNKYYKIYLRERLLLRKEETELAKMVKTRRLYYEGKLSTQEIAELNLPTLHHLITTKDVGMYMDADEALIDRKMSILMQSEKVEYLKAILDNINRRTFKIKNAIEFIKFTNGSL
jgi:hypothetical protein